METLQNLGAIFTIIGTFIGLNIILISMTRDVANIIFGNIFLGIIGILFHLVLEVQKLKGSIR